MATDNGGAGGGCGNGGEPELSDSLKTFGAVLKALRDEARLTQEQFAPLVQYSVAYIAKIEQGKRFPPRDLLDRVEAVLGPSAARVLAAAAKSLTRKAGLASWFRQWAGIEEEAISLYTYECRAIPGLLQPESYIRAAFERRLPPLSEEQVERQVATRLERQKLLTELPHTAFSFIIEQALLERQMGGPSVQRMLLEQLLEAGVRRNVEVQVMPLRQYDHAGIDGLMYLAETSRHEWVGYVEGQQSSVLITNPGDVSAMLQRYGKLRSQALGREATASLLEQMRGAL
ncbi:helix-turn-helix transcriptional regulator [Streptomyces chumphonensis]|uniref:Helix-turn-helix transcriptional regulator n=1 Tax=Streptomyces chumphonensis TaxID=1214925 RepID=A0A927EWC4_9ACTN|nr:helix-turn-helix transcriptional regulator [Streptomyces chumphonensis]MBD3930162.1 helix-turn-helix transcriptional regulator [Streptomyces chumphonensis]